jgi:predicted transcriptional regulator
MHNENVNRAIKLQLEINKQIDKFDWAQEELVNDLENLLDTLNSHECELLCEWYNKQPKNENERYIQMEIDFLREQEGQMALLSQWDV